MKIFLLFPMLKFWKTLENVLLLIAQWFGGSVFRSPQPIATTSIQMENMVSNMQL
ncbi:hypothetical protein AB205_0163920, partial [Aquarana catesbeiana]